MIIYILFLLYYFQPLVVNILNKKMSTYWHAAVFWTSVLTGVFGSIGGADEIKMLTEKDLSSFVAKSEFIMVLYCKYCYRF